MRVETPLPCALCGRLFDPKRLTRHHCVPKEKGGSVEDIELLCGQCHSMVHCTYTNGTLAQQYPAIAELRQAPELQPFLRWVRKQPATRRTKNKPRKRKL